MKKQFRRLHLVKVATLLVIVPILLNGQSSLQEDTLFFQQQVKQYERWLTETHLGHALSVHQVRLRKGDDTELELVLTLHPSDPDSAVNYWYQLKKDFSVANPEQSLEEKLFRVFVHKMEVPATKSSILLYIRDKKGEVSVDFRLLIWEEDGKVKMEKKGSRAQFLDIQVKPVVVRKVVKDKVTEVRRTASAEEVFDSILAFARQRFEPVRCYDRYPKVEEITRTVTMLEFSVPDLCREALPDETESTWCAIYKGLGGNCNDIRRERLTFQFTYSATGNTGYNLHCRLEGKFGSGVFKPRKGGYMDMEPDFKDELETYAKNFQEQLKAKLEGR